MTDWRYIVLKPAQRYLERLRPDDQGRLINTLSFYVERQIERSRTGCCCYLS